MKSLFQRETLDEVMARIEQLRPTSQREWGKMDVAQMMAHCSATFDVASGRVVLPRMLIGRILGPFVRPHFSNDKPFSKNGPTHKTFVISDQRDFAREREQLKDRVQRFHAGGEGQCTKHPHAFFGPLTPQEWGIGMYKHLDHHLRQFGV
jgi:hypothetical protein